MNRSPVFAAISLALCLNSTLCIADAQTAQRLDRIDVRGARPADPLSDTVLPQVVDGKIMLGKKNTAIDVSQQPVISNSNPRALFARAPGIQVSEQYGQGQWNLGYRGLGDPHESEFVTVLMDSVPIMSDWMTYNTLLWAPPLQRIAEVQIVHGGSGLLYGPQPGPSINLVMRRPEPGAPLTLRTDVTVGSHGFRGNYNEIGGGAGSVGFLLSTDVRANDGERVRGGSLVKSVMGSMVFAQSESAFWTLDVNGFQSFNHEAGRLTFAQWQNNPDLSIRPFDDFRVQRFQAVLGHERALSEQWSLDAKLWAGYQDRWSRRAGTVLPGQPRPAFTTFDRQQFQFIGLDTRTRLEWGTDHTLTAGGVLYSSDSPRSQGRANDLLAPRQTSIRFNQERTSDYRAVFAENAFRWGAFSVVPAVRAERIGLDVDETTRLASLRRPAIKREFNRSTHLLGLGLSYAWPQQLETYANFSQGYRPMRFDDIANPSAELTAANDPALSKSRAAELGLRGAPLPGFSFDVSAFRIDFDDKIEQRLVGVSDIERINSGDARHQGLDVMLDYNWLAAGNSGDSLRTYVSNTWLDAEIVRSVDPALRGKRPQFSPNYLARVGVLYGRASGLKASLGATLVASQFWQDSNLPRNDLPARMPSYRVVDFSVEYPLFPELTLTASIDNLTDQTYYSRIRTDGIEPAPGRAGYLGMRVDW